MRRFVLYAFIFVAGCVVGLWASDGAVWHAVSGPPDLGRADFAQADRPQNQFVACAAADAGVRASGPDDGMSSPNRFRNSWRRSTPSPRPAPVSPA